ncbi:MAG: tri-functional histidine biosynthesis [Lasallia pustulata]|uniref:Histidine biosynthesis trifunctional protein n=1 Tax=Lasallia pustulata TaxID=136370 RepID=A0A5M8Q510_9LECA|nr:MAG: tri-functional histidine biosynthesis [Lasallia pustulata]
MAERFLVSIDLKELQPNNEGGLDLKTISYLDRVYTSVTPETVDTACHFLQQHFNHFNTYLDVTALTDLKDIVLLLDNGAAKAFVEMHQLKAIVEDRLVEDLSRLVIALDHEFCTGDPANAALEIKQDVQNIVGSLSVGVYVRDAHDWKLLDKMHEISSLDDYPTRYVSLADNTWDHYRGAVKHGHIPIVPAKALTINPDQYPHLIPAELLITTSLVSDRPDGLYPTVVTDEHGICLGLVYSNIQSVTAALRTGTGVYWSRHRGLWHKGKEGGDTQELVSIGMDCDADALRFVVRQKGNGFCHLKTSTCFGPYSGLSRLERTLHVRKQSAPVGSYTARMFKEPQTLQAKIMEEASELCTANTKQDIAAEAADLLYFALTKCVAEGVSFEDVEHNLDLKSLKTTRRKGDPKPQWIKDVSVMNSGNAINGSINGQEKQEIIREAASVPKSDGDAAGMYNGKIQMKRYKTTETDPTILKDVLQRPSQKSTDEIMNIVNPIIKEVRQGGDSAVLKYTHKFEKATSLTSPVLRAPFPQSLMQLPQETIEAIDVSFENIRRFHAAQKEEKPLEVETMPGVVCSRFSRPIERVGLYVPGGTAVLPSTALMLGVPAMVAGCKKIVMASPPRSDGTITSEIVYIAHKVGAESIVLAGGAQAVAAMAYGTESITKVDKILGPGNQFVTAGKMIVSNDTTAGVSIDMPAGPSEVLVIADKTANPAFVASDLLSQAEHGTDSQVVLIAVDLSERELAAIEDELHAQANALPRVDIVRGAIEHSVTLVAEDINEAMALSNEYAPEHLILQVNNPERVVKLVQNAGSVFVGPWTPESVGDYSAGVNHSLPTYGYAKQYSGVNLSSFTKHITSSNLTKEGLRNVGNAVMQLAKVEQLDAHRRAVSIRLEHMDRIDVGKASTTHENREIITQKSNKTT